MLALYLINWDCNPFLNWLAWYIKKSKQFNQSDIAVLTLTLSVNGPFFHTIVFGWSVFPPGLGRNRPPVHIRRAAGIQGTLGHGASRRQSDTASQRLSKTTPHIRAALVSFIQTHDLFLDAFCAFWKAQVPFAFLLFHLNVISRRAIRQIYSPPNCNSANFRKR